MKVPKRAASGQKAAALGIATAAAAARMAKNFMSLYSGVGGSGFRVVDRESWRYLLLFIRPFGSPREGTYWSTCPVRHPHAVCGHECCRHSSSCCLARRSTVIGNRRGGITAEFRKWRCTWHRHDVQVRPPTSTIARPTSSRAPALLQPLIDFIMDPRASFSTRQYATLS